MSSPMQPSMLADALMRAMLGSQVSEQEHARAMPAITRTATPTMPSTKDLIGSQVSEQEMGRMPAAPSPGDALTILMMLQKMGQGSVGPVEDSRPKTLEEALSQFFGSGAGGFDITAPVSSGMRGEY